MFLDIRIFSEAEDSAQKITLFTEGAGYVDQGRLSDQEGLRISSLLDQDSRFAGRMA